MIPASLPVIVLSAVFGLAPALVMFRAWRRGYFRALDALHAVGVPRDLMEVVVSRTAAAQLYGSGESRGGAARAGRGARRSGMPALGALFGFTRRQRPDARYARAAEARDAILLAVHARDAREAESLARTLAEGGGREPKVEAR